MLTDLVIGFPEFNTSSDYLVGDGDTDGGASAEYSHHTRRSHRSAKGKNDCQSFTSEESQTQSTGCTIPLHSILILGCAVLCLCV
jgi:hypothetical protein